MGVYHISGLGLSPGALTMPLTCVYILQVAARFGHEEARKFFELSGEAPRKGSYEKHKGEPEAIIVLDSKEAIEGGLPLRYESRWFKMQSNGKEPIERPIVKYICKLLSHLNGILEKEGLDAISLPKYLYLVTVDYQDFENALDTAGALLLGFERKEVWVNLIGGSNQLNLALMIAGDYTMIPARYYYVFQNSSRLEPEWLDKLPRKREDFMRSADIILNRWYDLPPLNLGYGDILRRLIDEFSYRQVISRSELEQIIADAGYGRPSEFIPKLISTRYIVPLGKDVFGAGGMLERVKTLFEKIEEHRKNLRNMDIRRYLGDKMKEVEFSC
ncbi:hypothetical protein A3L04_02775 [Thermococcus chitonophagus]|uniref:CRISPR-associated protein n=1 Tax=Thermococcus chitonophagus TaxID=54262 RepID=A0A160VSC6_9EURY|nr:hypothetical protein [Thermococcus chitonophagus]ASJ16077.1 hypothetical protein A3L04_02775 [Thermococcus chitonophagus]CUX77326.1 hypothetical protein CHITON_0547 [Thermococcus chitonophagus]